MLIHHVKALEYGFFSVICTDGLFIYSGTLRALVTVQISLLYLSGTIWAYPQLYIFIGKSNNRVSVELECYIRQ